LRSFRDDREGYDPFSIILIHRFQVLLSARWESHTHGSNEDQ